MDEVAAFTFGSFRLISAERTFFEDGKASRLGSRAFDILVALIERAGQTISKEELIARAWPGTLVEEAASGSMLRRCTKPLPMAVSASAASPTSLA